MMIDSTGGRAPGRQRQLPLPGIGGVCRHRRHPCLPWWQPDVMGIRAAQALPAGLGDTVMGRRTHLTLTVYKQDRLLTLQTPGAPGRKCGGSTDWNQPQTAAAASTSTLSSTFPSGPTPSSRPSSVIRSSGSSTSSARSSPSDPPGLQALCRGPACRGDGCPAARVGSVRAVTELQQRSGHPPELCRLVRAANGAAARDRRKSCVR
jgi:hypothetical protein